MDWGVVWNWKEQLDSSKRERESERLRQGGEKIEEEKGK